jgi:hypothetical protein
MQVERRLICLLVQPFVFYKFTLITTLAAVHKLLMFYIFSFSSIFSFLILFFIYLLACLLIYLFIYAAVGLELRAYTPLVQFFVIGFFKTGSRELFAWAGFEP